MEKMFVSNSQDSSRMFKSNLLESLSKVHFTVPLIIYVPVIIYFGWKGYAGEILPYLLFLAGGLVFWTLTEYTLHRFVFHYQPTSSWGKKLHFIFHGVHHDYPNDAFRLVMPPSASIPLATGFYFLFSLFLDPPYQYVFFAAFMTGYLFYDITHYALHHFNFKGAIWKKLKQHHMLHHYTNPDKGYGVSSPLWDKIFRTDL